MVGDHTSGPMIQLIKSVTKELYENEDVETKAAVTAKMAEQARDLNEEGDEDLQRTPEQYQE